MKTKAKIIIISLSLLLCLAVSGLAVYASTGARASDLPVSESYVLSRLSFQAIELKKGQKISGTCEIILRSGTADAVCPGADMLSDITVGADIPNQEAIQKNHLLVIPRNDGRAVVVTSGTAFFMVRGDYIVQ